MKVTMNIKFLLEKFQSRFELHNQDNHHQGLLMLFF